MDFQAGDNTERFEEMRDYERNELLHALKAKWDTVNQKYQLMVSTLSNAHSFHSGRLIFDKVIVRLRVSQLAVEGQFLNRKTLVFVCCIHRRNTDER